MMRVLALDIGGANIKATRAVIADGCLHDLRATTIPFALWRATDELEDRLHTVRAALGGIDALAVTMTGELCDCFASRREGVMHILGAVASFAGGVPIRVWSHQHGFISEDNARAQWVDVASANWHAQATFLAKRYPDDLSLMIDVGSTTADILRLERGAVVAEGFTDAQRLQTGELIYTGAARTPLMAVMNEWGEGAVLQRFAAELFATMADVHVLLGDVPEDDANFDTADGRPLTKFHAAARLLRMVGSDLSVGSMQLALQWATRFAEAQQEQIAAGVQAVLREHLPRRILISGSGSFIARRVARDTCPQCEVVAWADELSSTARVAGSEAACAVAMLHLWE